MTSQTAKHNAMLIDRIKGIPASLATANSDRDPRNPNSPSVLFDLSKNVCAKCGTGHLDTPCAGGSRCTCACRNCNARMRHHSAA